MDCVNHHEITMKWRVVAIAKEGSLAEAMLSPTPSVEPSGGMSWRKGGKQQKLYPLVI